ncbi:MAG: hypothetical protein QOF29_2370 [bacterium]|nr:hypothetical protein [Solirubrobacteraceae bacterium]
MSRAAIITLAALGLVVFLALSLLLARWLTTEGEERDAVYALLQDQARGDAGAMLARLDGCARDAGCATAVERNATRLRRPGEVKILAYQSATAYALGGAQGRTRVAWTVIDRGLPVVQCVDVERAGSVLAGRTITLRRLSSPIGGESSC